MTINRAISNRIIVYAEREDAGANFKIASCRVHCSLFVAVEVNGVFYF